MGQEPLPECRPVFFYQIGPWVIGTRLGDCPRIKREIAVIKQMVRDSSTHKETAERVRRRRNRRRKRSRQNTSLMLPENSTSPSSTKKATSTNRNVAQGSNKEEDWPALPRIQPAKEPAQPSHPAPTSKPISAGDAPRVDRQIVPMLRSLGCHNRATEKPGNPNRSKWSAGIRRAEPSPSNPRIEPWLQITNHSAKRLDRRL